MRLSEPTAFLAPSMALQPACQLLALQTAPLDWLVVLAFLVLASRSKDRVDTAHLLLTIVTCRRLQSATIELVTLAGFLFRLPELVVSVDGQLLNVPVQNRAGRREFNGSELHRLGSKIRPRRMRRGHATLLAAICCLQQWRDMLC